MMWRCVDLVHSFLPLVSTATFWCVVYAQNDTDGPCKTYPKECVQRQYARYWWTSMWGFIVTLVALTMDVWGAGKTMEATIGNPNFYGSFCIAALYPCHIIWGMFEYTLNGMAMLANLREALGDNVIAPLYPWSKSHIKIVAGSKVIVNLSPNVYRENHNLNAFDLKVVVEDLSEALVIGPRVANSNCFNVRLTTHGQLALLRSNVLPPYDELKFLRGSSSLAMAIASAQAIGYIYGILVRCVQGLQVSPLEAIACILNMVILIKGVLHNFASLGHRLLLLYLPPEEETKFIEECKKIQGFKFEIGGRFKLAVSIACSVLLIVGAYFIVDFLKSCKRCIVPVILFEVGLVLGGINGLTMHLDYNDTLEWFLMIPLGLLSVVGYSDALDVTFRYWKREEFDVQSSNFLSQVLPYIG